MLVYFLSLLEDDSDRAILEEMYRRYKDKTLHIAMRILHDTYDAEDAVIDGWVKVVLNFDIAKKCYSNSWSEFGSWLTFVMKNTAKDVRKRRRRKRALETIEILDIPSPADTEVEGELKMVFEKIHSMPAQTRDLLEMRILGEYSFEEIGKSLGCSEGTAQKRFSRAMKAFREQFT